jgi:hypothetical protein
LIELSHPIAQGGTPELARDLELIATSKEEYLHVIE